LIDNREAGWIKWDAFTLVAVKFLPSWSLAKSIWEFLPLGSSTVSWPELPGKKKSVSLALKASGKRPSSLIQKHGG